MQIRRGNTLKFKIDITQGGQPYTLTAADTVYFTVKKRADKNSEILFQKILTYDSYENGELIVEILPEDTENMPIGMYKFDVAIQMGEHFYTIICPTDFSVNNVVTDYIGGE